MDSPIKPTLLSSSISKHSFQLHASIRLNLQILAFAEDCLLETSWFRVVSFQGGLETFGDSESVGPVGHVSFVELALDKQNVGDVDKVAGTVGNQFKQDQVLR